MRIENNQYNILIQFIGRAKDGLNVWHELQNDANSIEIFLGYTLEDSWSAVGGMCIPIKNIVDLHNGLLQVYQNKHNEFVYSCPIPLKDITDEFFSVSARRTNNNIIFHIRIFDDDGDYAELTEIMSETKFSNIIQELKDIIEKYPII